MCNAHGRVAMSSLFFSAEGWRWKLALATYCLCDKASMQTKFLKTGQGTRLGCEIGGTG